MKRNIPLKSQLQSRTTWVIPTSLVKRPHISLTYPTPLYSSLTFIHLESATEDSFRPASCSLFLSPPSDQTSHKSCPYKVAVQGDLLWHTSHDWWARGQQHPCDNQLTFCTPELSLSPAEERENLVFLFEREGAHTCLPSWPTLVWPLTTVRMLSSNLLRGKV